MDSLGFTFVTLYCGKLLVFFFRAPNSISEGFSKNVGEKRPAHNI